MGPPYVNNCCDCFTEYSCVYEGCYFSRCYSTVSLRVCLQISRWRSSTKVSTADLLSFVTSCRGASSGSTEGQEGNLDLVANSFCSSNETKRFTGGKTVCSQVGRQTKPNQPASLSASFISRAPADVLRKGIIISK